MDSGSYFVLEIGNIPQEKEDILVAELFEVGAAGVQENLKFQQKDKKYLPEVVASEIKNLVAYFEQTPTSESLQSLQEKFSEFSFTLNEQPIKDWLSEWKAQWKAFSLVENFWVVPEWEKENVDLSDKNPIFIEPGMAFGTGTHATTQVASELIYKLLGEQKLETAVDVGTGSGILSLLMEKISIKKMYAYDNDPESERVFKENNAKNQGQGIWVEQWSNELIDKVQLCVANIIDGVLIELKPEFQKLNSQYYIFTGVLLEREQGFLSEMLQNWNLELMERKAKDEWVGFLFEAKQ